MAYSKDQERALAEALSILNGVAPQAITFYDYSVHVRAVAVAILRSESRGILQGREDSFPSGLAARRAKEADELEAANG